MLTVIILAVLGSLTLLTVGNGVAMSYLSMSEPKLRNLLNIDELERATGHITEIEYERRRAIKLGLPPPTNGPAGMSGPPTKQFDTAIKTESGVIDLVPGFDFAGNERSKTGSLEVFDGIGSGDLQALTPSTDIDPASSGDLSASMDIAASGDLSGSDQLSASIDISQSQSIDIANSESIDLRASQDLQNSDGLAGGSNKLEEFTNPETGEVEYRNAETGEIVTPAEAVRNPETGELEYRSGVYVNPETGEIEYSEDIVRNSETGELEYRPKKDEWWDKQDSENLSKQSSNDLSQQPENLGTGPTANSAPPSDFLSYLEDEGTPINMNGPVTMSGALTLSGPINFTGPNQSGGMMPGGGMMPDGGMMPGDGMGNLGGDYTDAEGEHALASMLGSLDGDGEGPGQTRPSSDDLSEMIGDKRVVRYPNGQPRFEIQLDNGVPNGSFRAWYPNGTRMGVGEYNQGKASGVWTIWNQQGKKMISADIGDVKAGRFKKKRKLNFVKAR